MKRQVFFSFHYQDAWKVAQIKNMGIIEGQEIFTSNDWEKVKRKGDNAIKNWIDSNMQNRSCLVVLIGKDTISRRWVKYEIKKAWKSGKGIFGIYIHNLKDQFGEKSSMGLNPFEQFNIGKINMSKIVRAYNPKNLDAYQDINDNIDNLIEEAIEIRKKY